MTVEPLLWRQHRLWLLDQTELPRRVRYFTPDNYRQVIAAIRRLSVRGAPLIGIAAAYGLAQEAQRLTGSRNIRKRLLRAAVALAAARPTAVNLSWAIQRLAAILNDHRIPESELAARLEQEATVIHQEERTRSMKLGALGNKLIPANARIMTICNAGRLAAPGFGTALAPVYLAHQQGKQPTVYVPETRPLLQGARLTAWELSNAGIPVVLLTDSMVSLLMPEIDLILVGADRIAANGDAANKVGTYQLSLLAHHFHRPFYVVAPVSTFDFKAGSARDIPIEERSARELQYCGKWRVAPKGISYHNPAFDVTPAKFITGIITDAGILYPPYRRAFATLRRRLRAFR